LPPNNPAVGGKTFNLKNQIFVFIHCTEPEITTKDEKIFQTTYRDIRRFKKRSELKCGFSPCGYRVLSDVLLLFWRVAKIRGAVKQIFLGSGEVNYHPPHVLVLEATMKSRCLCRISRTICYICHTADAATLALLFYR
jgi:hypothetical protein